MTLILELPVELENDLRADAKARGVAVEFVAVEWLRAKASDTHQHAAQLWARLSNPQTHNAAILEIAQAPAKVRALIDDKGAAAAAAFYATPDGAAELADWRARDGEPFDLGENA